MINVARFNHVRSVFTTGVRRNISIPGFGHGKYFALGPVEEWNTRFVIAQPVISIIGIVDAEGRVTVQSVMRLLAVPVVENAGQTSFRSSLLDANQQVIAEGA